MNNSYFFDTYALFEIIRANKKYEPYLDSKMVITIFNLAELNYNLKKEFDKKRADEITENYKDYVIKVLYEDIILAMDMKNKKRDLSIPDAIGYTVAKRLKIKFLTGDEDFRDFDNVEFIKK